MVGIHLVAATFVGLAIGYVLDGFFGTTPWLTMIFLFLGIGTGFRDLFRMIKFDDEEEQESNSENEDLGEQSSRMKKGPKDE